LLDKSSFLVNYTDFILLLLYVPVPWTAINLVEHYLVRHGQYDVDSFFRQDGGMLYTGPIAAAMGGSQPPSRSVPDGTNRCNQPALFAL